MPVKNTTGAQNQSRLFAYKLSEELSHKNKLYQLRSIIDWPTLESYVRSTMEISPYGRDRHSIRVLLGLILLQAMYNTSDNLTAAELEENVYWQYFCGYEYMEKVQVSESCIRRFRQHLGESGFNEIQKEIIKAGIKVGAIKKKI